MPQIRTFAIMVVYDDYAIPGLQWWARCDTDAGGGVPDTWCTALHAGAVDALDELAALIGWLLQAPSSEESPTR